MTAAHELTMAREALVAAGHEPTDAAVAGYLAAALAICRHMYATEASAGHTRAKLTATRKSKRDAPCT